VVEGCASCFWGANNKKVGFHIQVLKLMLVAFKVTLNMTVGTGYKNVYF